MSSISMEWLEGPIVLNLKEDEILIDLAEGYVSSSPDGLGNPDGPATLDLPATLDAPSLETPVNPDGLADSCADSATEAA